MKYTYNSSSAAIANLDFETFGSPVMATPKILALSNLLRRSRRPLSNSLLFSAQSNHHHFLRPTSPPSLPTSPVRHHTPYNSLLARSLSTSESVSHFNSDSSDLTRSELISAVNCAGTGGDGVRTGEESILPVQALISLLDKYQDLTGFPW